MSNKIPPCFYCDYPAEYTGEVAEKNGKFQVVEVCKNHFTGAIEASS